MESRQGSDGHTREEQAVSGVHTFVLLALELYGVSIRSLLLCNHV
jgi:hypothetical protein